MHGLNSTSVKCWSAKGNFLWLRDFLPEAVGLRDTQIATFDYNSQVSQAAPIGGIREHALALLGDLSNHRGDGEVKNILFATPSQISIAAHT